MTSAPETAPASGAPPARGRAGRAAFLLLGVACFAYLYTRLDGAAAREGLSLAAYMAQVFQNVQWGAWAALMVAYSGFYFLIDTLVVSRAINWFVTPLRYRDILPVRASAYIISVFNEQIGKGAMAYYLNRRHRVPGWEVGSVMLFVMFCEVFYLLFWATVGYLAGPELPPAFSLVPWLALAAVPVFAVWVLYFRGALLPGNRLRDRRIFHAFRTAELRHYALFLVLRSPALLAAVVVYTTALNLFASTPRSWPSSATCPSSSSPPPCRPRCGPPPSPSGWCSSPRTRARWPRSASSSTTSSSCSTLSSGPRSGRGRSASCSGSRLPSRAVPAAAVASG